MDTLKNVMFERYTLILKHDYEIYEQGATHRIKADDPLCITCTTTIMDKDTSPVFINEMIDRMKHELFKRIREADNE